ncbi:phosphatidylserine decarboxylase 1 [Saccharomyces pastorianus]|uniref:Phosphatidylserine decarboxylase proenzyme 1, mitochondrial n=1 Tax=Saccharomyces pastorianus TaxID=27292 RepID=A0A6C1EE19_SACPS|nr:phosphatidylserine decarboxylase 1 [Saccharomyces pastorianus]
MSIMPVKNALAQGRTLLMGRMPAVKFSTRMQLRNKTAVLWNRRFSTRLFVHQRRSSGEIVDRAKAAAANSGKKQVSMKWVVLTSFTIVLGTILLVSRNDKTDEEDDTKSKKGTRTRKIKIFNNNWLFFCYSTLPLNAMSRLWGQVNSLTLPIWVRPWGYRLYSFLFGVNLDEMEDPDLTHYANLSEFFYRNIKPDTRPVAQGENVISSPSDGKILQVGIINSETGEIEQVKGMTYSIKEFLGTHSHPLMSKSESSLDLTSDEEKHKEFARINNFQLAGAGDTEQPLITIKNEGDQSVEEFKPSVSKNIHLLSQLSLSYFSNGFSCSEPHDTELFFAVIYLAPGDYHHFHSPIDWVCKVRRHFPGDLFSVAPYFQRNFPNLFILNERVALLGGWKYGFFSMTPVGATNVGSIKLNFDQEFVTNSKSDKHLELHTCYQAIYENASKILGGMPLVKGEEMGGFELGSTVVLCFEAPTEFKFKVNVGDKVKMGQELGIIENKDSK